jgi:hypothetical protein
MAERTTTPEISWPSKREMLDLGYTLGYLQATVDHHKMQQSPPMSGGGRIGKLLKAAKDWADGFEMLQRLWALRRPLGLTVLIASWWEHLIWLLRLIVG